MTSHRDPSPKNRFRPRAPALAIDELDLSYVVRGTPRASAPWRLFEVRPGEAYGLVGESGCGKSTTAYAALRYLPATASDR